MRRLVTAVFVLAAAALSVKAQYYQIANQLPGLLSPALSRSVDYKGFVETKGVAGIGHNRANSLGVSTTQGFRYSQWFYMGVGLGVDVVMGQDGLPDYTGPRSGGHYECYHSSERVKVMIPVFTDFRFSIPSGRSATSPSVFVDLKLGAAWLLGDSYLRLNDRMLMTATQFYMSPTVGIRIPVSQQKPDRAFNIGLTYQLLTADGNYDCYDGNSASLNSVGVTIGYEW